MGELSATMDAVASAFFGQHRIMGLTVVSKRNALARFLVDMNTERGAWIGFVRSVAPPPVLSHADAEDVLQEAGLRAFRSAETLASDDPEKIRRWFRQIVRNSAVSILRGHRVILRTVLDGGDGRLDRCSARISSPAQLLEMKETLEHIQRVIRKLSTEQSAVFSRVYTCDQSIREVSEDLGMSRESVSSCLYRAKRRLRDALEPGLFMRHRREPP